MTVLTLLIVGTVTNRIQSNFDSLFGARLNLCCSTLDGRKLGSGSPWRVKARGGQAGEGHPQNSVGLSRAKSPRKFAMTFRGYGPIH
jgi:hypothetical protein